MLCTGSEPFTAREAAVFYRTRHHWNPLPSRADAKRPALCFAEFWDGPIEQTILDHWEAPNIQLMCGVRWDLAVVDIDRDLSWGEDWPAADAWRAMTLFRPVPKTWTVRTGGGGLHLYFRLPGKVKELPSRCLWDSGEKHHRIDLLGDHSLVVAPPSRHVTTGRPYEFLVGPEDLPEPALLPLWIAKHVDMRARADRFPVEPPLPPRKAPMVAYHGHSFDRKAVLDAIADKLALVRSWGLRVRGWIPNKRGWLSCRAIGREDCNPSAGFHVPSGYYCEPPAWRMSLFDIAVLLGVYPTWLDAVNQLGCFYLGIQ